MSSSIVCTQLNGYKFSKWLNISIWPIDKTQTGTTTPDQSWHGSNGNEVVLHIPQISWTWASPFDGSMS